MAVQNITAQTITIEAVNAKPKFPKFSSGSVLANGEWLSVSKSLDISKFQKQTTVNVDIETNDRGYKSIVGINTMSTEPVVPKYETSDTKSHRITRQGAIQNAYRTAALMGLLGGELDQEARRIADNIVAYTEE